MLESDLVPMVEDTYKLGSVPISDELYAQSYGCQKSSSTHSAEHGGASEPARDTFPLNAPPRGVQLAPELKSCAHSLSHCKRR